MEIFIREVICSWKSTETFVVRVWRGEKKGGGGGREFMEFIDRLVRNCLEVQPIMNGDLEVRGNSRE